MSLKPIEGKNLQTFLRTGAFTSGNYFYGVSPTGAPPKRANVYYDRLDAVYSQGKINNDPGAHTEVHFAIDPLGLDNTSPVSRWGLVSGGLRAGQWCVGEWDKVANTQRIYIGTDPPQEFWPMDPVTFLIDNSVNLWPFLWQLGAGGSGGAIGGWDETGGASGNFVFFETWGYAVRGCAEVKHTDSNIYRGLALINLSDGKATLLDVPTFFTSSPAALFEAPEFNGDSFTLGVPQFAADDDSLPAAPKGRLFLFQSDYLGDAAAPNANCRFYMKVIDWNPLGVDPAPGTSNRVHLRETLLTVVRYITHQAYGTNPNSMGAADDGGTPSVRQIKLYYHPPSRTVCCWNDMKWSTFDNQRGLNFHSITPELTQIEAPTAQQDVETNKTTVFKARALGDLGEPVAGIDGVWSLARRSTIDEALDTSAAPAVNVVAHPPIDPDSLVVKLNGTPLTVGVDYTVVESTGAITWIGAQSPPAASGYTATYEHSNTSAQPPHGSLLSELSQTAEDGIAETRVQYPDDDELANDLDRITVTLSDD